MENLPAKNKACASTVFGVLSINIPQYLLQVFYFVRKIILHALIIVRKKIYCLPA